MDKSINKSGARQLDKTTLALANANVELLAAQEELEAKNKQLMQLLEELANSKDELQAILDTSNSAIVMVNPLGTITAGNQQIIDFFDLGDTNVLGASFNQFIEQIKDRFTEPKEFISFIQRLEQNPNQPYTDEFYSHALQTCPPRQRYISLMSTAVTNKERTRTLGRSWIFFDITEVRAADEKLRAIVEASPVPYIISQISTGKIIYVNKALAELSGYNEEELLEKSTIDFYQNARDRDKVLSKLSASGQLHNEEIQFKKADGQFIWMILSIVTSTIRNEPVYISSLYNIDERRKAEEALQQEQNFISAVLDTAPAIVLVLDMEGRVIRMNKAGELHSGKTMPEHRGTLFWDLFRNTGESRAIKSRFTDLVSGNSPNTIETVWTSVNGERHLFTWSTSLLHDANAKTDNVIVIGTDITQRKITEEKLSLYREIFKNSNDAIAVVAPDGKLIERNPAHSKHTGYSDKEAEGMFITEFIDKKCSQDIIDSLSKTDGYRGESLAVHKSGKKIDIDLSIFTIKDNTEQPKYYVGIARDIRERKKVEKALQKANDELEIRVHDRTKQLEEANRSLLEEINERKQAQDAYARSAEQVRAFLEAIPDLIFRLNKTGHYLDYHAPKNSNLSVPREQVIGRHISETLPPELIKDAELHIKRALSSGEIQVWEYQLAHGDRLCDFEARIIVSGKDEVLAIVRDITSQKQARVALERANDLLEQRVKERTNALAKTNEALLEEISDRIKAEQDLGKRLRYEEGLAVCSQALLKYNDLSPALEHAVKGLLEASDTNRACIYKNVMENGTLHHSNLYHKCTITHTGGNGASSLERLTFGNTFSRWTKTLATGKPLFGLTKDFPVPEREILQELKIRSLLVLPIFIENNWWGFIGFEDLDKERLWTENDVRLLKLASEMIGGYIDKKNAEEALMVSEKRYRTLVENAHDIIFSMKPDGTFAYISPQFYESTGYKVEAFIGKSLEPLVHPEDLHAFKSTLSSDHSHELSYRIKHKNGEWRWFISHTTLLYDENGNQLDRIGIAHDVTVIKTVMSNLEKTNQELHKTQAQLVQSEKMGALGMLVAGIAHEINTPVGAIHSMHNTLIRAVNRLNQELGDNYPELYSNNEQLKKSLTIINDANRVIESGTDRVTSIVKRLRSFARLDEAELKDADIHEGIEDTLVIIHHEVKHDITIIRDFGVLPVISCYPGRLNQVFLNLLINARQAIAGKGEIRIKTFRQNSHVVIQISDNGKGIAPENLDRIFDPGFTTKGVGVGTGLGLSICYRIIQKHNGIISVESVEAKGSTFVIELPKK